MLSKKTILISLSVILLIALTGFAINQDKIPKGWMKVGSKPESYEVGIEIKAGQDGTNAAYLKSIKENIEGFGTLMQSFSAGKYLDKRVRFSGYVKSKNVVQWAGLWMRIDGKADPSKPLAFDNMQDRPITGTTEWKKFEVVLDVPSNGNLINIGILLAGTGEVWFSDFKLDIVDKSIPTTGLESMVNKVEEPVNMNFEN
jgi:hypothetical protein